MRAQLLAVAFSGCEQMEGYGTNRPADSPATTNAPAPDNAASNKRDAAEKLKTPIDQSEDVEDVKRTAEIRKRVLKQSDLSVNARNVKIITEGGKVTLRGPVKTAGERDIIGTIAVEVAGEENVDNQIDVPTAAP
ncbi:MAG: BON domain-containing protein [Pirellulales bacterium]